MRTISREDIIEHARKTFQPVTKEQFLAYFEEADKPLVDDADRVEVIMLVIDNDRAEASLAIEGLFKTEYPFKLTVYENKRNPRNTSKIWNKLVRESTAEYILIIDSDVIPQNDIITPMLEVLTRNPDVAAVGPVGFGALPLHQCEALKVDGNPIEVGANLSGCCFMFKKSTLETIGYWDEDFVFYGQDSEWGARAVSLKYKLFATPRAYIFHGSSLSATRLAAIGEMNPNHDSLIASVVTLAKTQ